MGNALLVTGDGLHYLLVHQKFALVKPLFGTAPETFFDGTR